MARIHSLTENRQISEKIDQRGVTFTCCDVLPAECGVIIFGTTRGSIRIYLWPWDPMDTQAPDNYEIGLSTGSITFITHSYDLSFLFVGAEDGSLYFLRMQEIQAGIEVENLYDNRRQADVLNYYYLNEMSMSSKLHQEMKKDMIKELQFRIDNQKSDIDDEKDKLTQIKNQYVRMIEDKNSRNIHEQKENLTHTMEDADYKYRNLQQLIEENRENYRKTRQSMIDTHESKLLELYREYDEQQEVKRLLMQEGTTGMESYNEKLDEMFREMQEKYIADYNELEKRWIKAEKNYKIDQIKCQEVMTQEESEHKEFLFKMKKILKEELESEQQRSETLRTTISKLNKDCNRFKLRRTELDTLVKETEAQIRNLEEEK